jgi:hypothetical protein
MKPTYYHAILENGLKVAGATVPGSNLVRATLQTEFGDRDGFEWSGGPTRLSLLVSLACRPQRGTAADRLNRSGGVLIPEQGWARTSFHASVHRECLPELNDCFASILGGRYLAEQGFGENEVPPPELAFPRAEWVGETLTRSALGDLAEPRKAESFARVRRAPRTIGRLVHRHASAFSPSRAVVYFASGLQKEEAVDRLALALGGAQPVGAAMAAGNRGAEKPFESQRLPDKLPEILFPRVPGPDALASIAFLHSPDGAIARHRAASRLLANIVAGGMNGRLYRMLEAAPAFAEGFNRSLGSLGSVDLLRFGYATGRAHLARLVRAMATLCEDLRNGGIGEAEFQAAKLDERRTGELTTGSPNDCCRELYNRGWYGGAIPQAPDEALGEVERLGFEAFREALNHILSPVRRVAVVAGSVGFFARKSARAAILAPWIAPEH